MLKSVGRQFVSPVTWEFNARLQGEGVDCRSALLAALANKYNDVDKASPGFLAAIERNETWMIAGELVHGSSGPKVKDYMLILLLLAFLGASVLFVYRYREMSAACLNSGRSTQECERILR